MGQLSSGGRGEGNDTVSLIKKKGVQRKQGKKIDNT